MRAKELGASLALAGAGALAACTSGGAPERVVPTPSEAVRSDVPPLVFRRDLYGQDYALVDCSDNPHGWAVATDSNPDRVAKRLVTVAAVETSSSKVQVMSGATIRKLGAGAYQIATSEHVAPDTSTIVDLDNESYAQVLRTSPNYSISFSAQKGPDGKAYFYANCLPFAGYGGDQNATVVMPPQGVLT